jgi:hypothetical protein
MENIWSTRSQPLGPTGELLLELCPPIDVSTIPVFDPRAVGIYWSLISRCWPNILSIIQLRACDIHSFVRST